MYKILYPDGSIEFFNSIPSVLPDGAKWILCSKQEGGIPNLPNGVRVLILPDKEETSMVKKKIDEKILYIKIFKRELTNPRRENIRYEGFLKWFDQMGQTIISKMENPLYFWDINWKLLKKEIESKIKY